MRCSGVYALTLCSACIAPLIAEASVILTYDLPPIAQYNRNRGDLNRNGTVDSADMLILKAELGNRYANVSIDNDADVDGADFLIWQRNVGRDIGFMYNWGAASKGDFFHDRRVDGNDLTMWRYEFGQFVSPADSDADFDVDGADFLLWQRKLGSTQVSSVPESPSAIIALGLATSMCAWLRRQVVGSACTSPQLP